MQLYKYPHLYEVLRAPDPETLEIVQTTLTRHLPSPLRSLMDPACGPATWLLPFAGDSIHLAGNDLSGEMVHLARQRLNGHRGEIIQGDMFNLKFATGPFDVALEVSGAISQLLDDASLLRFLRSVAAHTRPGGLVLVTLIFEPSDAYPSLPHLVYRTPPRDVSVGGHAWITYEVVERFPEQRRETIRRTVHCLDVPGCPPRIEDSYPMRIWTRGEIFDLLASAPDLEFIEAHGLDDGWIPPAEGLRLEGEQMLVFRRVAPTPDYSVASTETPAPGLAPTPILEPALPHPVCV